MFRSKHLCCNIPGPSRNTFGRNPLYKAAKPSSRKTVPTAGKTQLYFGIDPAILGEFCILLLTTSSVILVQSRKKFDKRKREPLPKGVFKIVPTVPPIVPEMISFLIC